MFEISIHNIGLQYVFIAQLNYQQYKLAFTRHTHIYIYIYIYIYIQCALDIPALDTQANALYRHISE